MPSMCYTASSTTVGLLATASAAYQEFLHENTSLFVVSVPDVVDNIIYYGLGFLLSLRSPCLTVVPLV